MNARQNKRKSEKKKEKLTSSRRRHSTLENDTGQPAALWTGERKGLVGSGVNGHVAAWRGWEGHPMSHPSLLLPSVFQD